MKCPICRKEKVRWAYVGGNKLLCRVIKRANRDGTTWSEYTPHWCTPKGGRVII